MIVDGAWRMEDAAAKEYAAQPACLPARSDAPQVKRCDDQLWHLWQSGPSFVYLGSVRYQHHSVFSFFDFQIFFLCPVYFPHPILNANQGEAKIYRG